MKFINLLIQYLLWAFCLYFSTATVQAQKPNKEVQFTQHKYLPFYNLKKVGNTNIFQGNKKEKNYFEGWYFKMVSKDESSIISVIPGISLSSDGKEQHAFIQIINGATAQTNYFSFPIDEFSFSKKEFAIKIADNYFSKDSIVLHLKDELTAISGKVKMNNRVAYQSGRITNSGIMGWYRFVPFMECYHGVVDLSNTLDGNIVIDNKKHNFKDGKGYIEKDWGSSMPSSWIWMQSNHFNEKNSSFMLSIADIPWLGKSFTGFLGFFYHNNEIHHFATYRNSELQLKIEASNQIIVTIKNRKNTFIIEAMSNQTGMLKAPVAGVMDRRIPESIDARVKITMLNKDGSPIFTDSTNIAGLEMVGDYNNLKGLIK